MSLRSSSEKSFVRRSSQKTQQPKAQQLSIVETVGLLPRSIMLEIVDWDKSASFASGYFDHLCSSRSSEIRAIKSISFTTSLHYNFIPKIRSSVSTNRLYGITGICVLFGIKCNEVYHSVVIEMIVLFSSIFQQNIILPHKYWNTCAAASSSETGCYISFTTLVKTRWVKISSTWLAISFESTSVPSSIFPSCPW